MSNNFDHEFKLCLNTKNFHLILIFISQTFWTGRAKSWNFVGSFFFLTTNHERFTNNYQAFDTEGKTPMKNSQVIFIFIHRYTLTTNSAKYVTSAVTFSIAGFLTFRYYAVSVARQFCKIIFFWKGLEFAFCLPLFIQMAVFCTLCSLEQYISFNRCFLLVSSKLLYFSWF